MADVDVLRSDLGVFADTAGVPLARWQVDSLKLETRVTAIVGPRQSGKSRSLSALALWFAFRRREQRVLIVSAGEEAARRLLAEIRRVATDSPLLRGSVIDEQAGLVTLSNGSEIRSVPGSERQIRGWSVDLLLCDEAGLIPDDLLLGAAIPTTAARPEARIVLAGSAVTAAGAFYDHVTRGEAGSEHVRSYRWALTECEWISPTVIQAARDSMTETRFAAEYEGVFASGADALFTRQALDRVTADYYIPPLTELKGPARVLAGVDWGVTNDRSALVAIARLPEAGEVRFGVCCAKRWPAGAQLTGTGGVVGEIVASPAHFTRITAETNGVGAPLVEELFRRLRERDPSMGGGKPPPRRVVDAHKLEEFFREERDRRARDRAWGRRGPWCTVKAAIHVTAEAKAATYSALRVLIDREVLLIPASATEMLRELLLLRVDLSPTGTERIEASSGHDDLADALAWALSPYRSRREKRWRTVLADIAESKALPAPSGVPSEGVALEDTLREAGVAPPVPRAPGRMVHTGSGIAVPRFPLFQSVTGAEVSGLDVQVDSARGAVVRRGRFTIERKQS